MAEGKPSPGNPTLLKAILLVQLSASQLQNEAVQLSASQLQNEALLCLTSPEALLGSDV